jgi:hypothetical protein
MKPGVRTATGYYQHLGGKKMTTKIRNTVFIAAEEAQECKLCGKFEECRPAGPNKEQVCWDCANKDKAAMQRYSDKLFGRKQ